MLRLIRFAMWLLARLLLPLRYRLTIDGLNDLRCLKGPTLVLPSHPAFVDPLLVMMVLWPRLRLRPMLYERNFRNPLLYPFMKGMQAVLIPDLEEASLQARGQAEQAVAEVIAGLKAGHNHILWPAGRLRRTATECLGATRAVADILAAVPDVNVVLVRTRGLWGSRFSYAYSGERPALVGNLLLGASLLLANLIYFTPRRQVHLTIRRVAPAELPEPRREALNPWLEDWYNSGGPETPTFVHYHFLFGPRTHEFPPLPTPPEADVSRVKAATKTAVAQILAGLLHRPLGDAEQDPGTTLTSLGLDSLDRMELALRVEQRFGFSGDQTPETVGQLWALAEGLVERAAAKPAPPDWFRPASDVRPLDFLGCTLPEAFVNRALCWGRNVAAADDVSGVLTYERLLVGVLTMARRVARVPGVNVGLLLPASVACDVAFFAVQLAGKVPVLLNWTTGPAHLKHAITSTNLTHVITSHRFLDRLGLVLEGVACLFVEDLRQDVGRAEQLHTLLEVRLFPGRIRARVPALAPDAVAVILFTSGSEKAPKTVPLTHANLLACLRAGTPVMGLTQGDIMLGFLPPFHSFGVAAAMLWPLLGGMRVVHHADPTDAARLARKIGSYRPTFLVGTPTLFGYVLDRARPGELGSLRLIVLGAEKCPAALFERCARVAPGALVLEGYGVTECAPVISFNPPSANRPGTIGRPLPGMDVLVIDLETNQPLPPGRMGMLLVSGPSVFPGYQGQEGAQPFQEHQGKRWYVTGDLVEMDADGYLTFRGRLKRFLKAGGEMISLPALEEPFERLYPPTPDGPRVAVEGIESDGDRHIALFTTEPLTLQEANARLLAEGFRGVMRLDEVRQVKAIPVLGTGKTDYKILRTQLASEAP